MPFIPAICNNTKCQTLFPSDIATSANDSNLTKETSYTCPACGELGTLSTANYDDIIKQTLDTLYNSDDIQLLKKAQKSIEKTLKKNASQKSVKSLITEVSEWSLLWKALPDDRLNTYAVLQLVLSFIIIALDNLAESEKIADSAVLINRAFNNYYQLVTPTLQPKVKRPQMHSLTSAIRKSQK